MGSKLSIEEEPNERKFHKFDHKKAIIIDRPSKQKTSTSLLHCCGDTFLSATNTTPSYDDHKIKRSRMCLNIQPKIILGNQEKYNNPQRTDQTCKKKKISREPKLPRKESFLSLYFELFDDDVIQDFLWMDSCYLLSDKYLLAMVYVYFRRASLTRCEYTRTNFFVALFLAHDMEEDNEDMKLEIYPWALGENWRHNFQQFISQKDSLLKRMDYRAVVSKLTCDEVINLYQHHPIWQRQRKASHGGALRVYPSDGDNESLFSPIGKHTGLTYCIICSKNQISSNTSGYFSVCSNSSSVEEDEMFPNDFVMNLSNSNKEPAATNGICLKEVLLFEE